ncbi:MAG: DUF2871 domain-containing protein, partial [Cellulomonas sp.]|nr:DUF2871 domain-containing protein [Cellulomonas sp.]
MTRLYRATIAYAVLGLLAGLAIRGFTQARDFTGATQLSVVHTHLLVLGFLLMLIVLLLDAVLSISGSRAFTWFFWTYNAGLLLTVGVMVWHGILQVEGLTVSQAVSGIAGLGHIVIT